MNNNFTYIMLTQYDLSMTLVVANITKDGILISSDGRGRGIDPNTNEVVISNSIKKTFAYDRFVWGLAGEGVHLPQYINNYISIHLVIKESDTSKDIATNIYKLCLEYHSIIELKQAGFDILFAGFDHKTPRIYKLTLSDGVVKVQDMGNYGSIGISDHADSLLSAIDTTSLSVIQGTATIPQHQVNNRNKLL